MKNFARALRDGLIYWRSLVLATLCSLGVAALWGANIGALYPIVEVTFGGESLQHWMARELAKSQQTIQDLDTALAQLDPRSPDLAVQAQIARLENRREAEEHSMHRTRLMRPWIERYVPDDPLQTVILVVAALLVGTLIKHALLLANTYLVAYVSNSIAQDIRRRIFKQAVYMDRAGFGTYGTSGFSANLTHTADMLTTGITNVFGGAIREPLKLLSCLIGAALICWRLLLVSMIVVPVVAGLIVMLSYHIKLACRLLLQRSMGFHHVMHEAFGNMQTVQAYNMQEEERRRFRMATDQMLEFSIRTEVLNALTRPITELLGIGMVGVTIVAGAYLVIHQETQIWGITLCARPLSISQVLVFFGLLVGASDPVRKMSTVFAGINTGIVAADMLYPLLDRPSRIADPREPRSVQRPHGRLLLRNVDFGYRPQDLVIRGLNLELAHGQRVAIVGPNGSGKSSLVNLLCRFYDPLQGGIELDGVDLRHMQLSDLRGRIALVTQQTELMNETVGYNIRYGTLGATEQQVFEAARLAHADQFIREQLPEGYQTRVGQHGHRLSGGQRQRIALARAILRNPDILILDEATSQIDMESESLIMETLRQYGQGRTLILITHRTSLLELADVVWRFDRGKVTVQRVADSRAA